MLKASALRYEEYLPPESIEDYVFTISLEKWNN